MESSEKLSFGVEAPKHSSPPQVASPAKALNTARYLKLSMENKNNDDVKVSDQDALQTEDKTGETMEEKQEDIREGEAEKNVYTEEAREEMVDEDGIEPWEEAFMEGAEGRGGQASCRQCGKLLSDDPEKVVERKIEEHDLRFCSDECAEKYMKRRGKKLLKE